MAQVIRIPTRAEREAGIRIIPLHRVQLVDEVRSDYVPPCVSPIAPERIARLVDPAEVEIYEVPPGVAIAEAYGGRIGIAVLFVAAAFIGFALALGGF